VGERRAGREVVGGRTFRRVKKKSSRKIRHTFIKKELEGNGKTGLERGKSRDKPRG